MLLRLAYPAVTNTFSFMWLLPMADRDKEIEILALRHQLTALQRQVPKPGFTPEDRFLLSGLLHHLPMDKLRQLVLLVHPDTLVRWHRDLLSADTRRPAHLGGRGARVPSDPSAPWCCGSHGRTPPGATGVSTAN
ncbi:hypothetical protein [Nonomuraea sp. NPDC050310]|uniref:hypothetical protein n=1 Tax=Nonomuraea sp. NPDC050310 TaxID=3154935 RepID=UPI0033F57EAD